MVKIAVVIPYFNPAGYASHERKLARTLAAFRSAGLAEDVYLTGAGGAHPLDAKVAFWDADCPFLWHKERLINLAVRRLPSAYTHVVWCDSDVIVGEDWADAVAAAFEKARLVQCFQSARYRSLDGAWSISRVSSLVPGHHGAMGLAWGADRSLFDGGPGLFDRAIVGGGDSILGRALGMRYETPSVPWLARHRDALARKWSAPLLTEQDMWVTRAALWLDTGGVVAAAAGIEVTEHGSREQRQYSDRQLLLGGLIPEEHLVDEPGRVLRWSDVGLAAVEPAVRAYFHSRREDDPGLSAEVKMEVQGQVQGEGAVAAPSATLEAEPAA